MSNAVLKCGVCKATVTLLGGSSSSSCSHCAAVYTFEDFNVDDPAPNLELENARSLRSIAMCLQLLTTADTARFITENPKTCGNAERRLKELYTAWVRPLDG